MTQSRLNVLVFACVLATVLPVAGHAQMGGPGGPGGRNGGPMNPRDSFSPPRMIGRPGEMPSEQFPGGRFPSNPPEARLPGKVDVVPLTDVVSMVQGRFNATAVKTDTVMEEDQPVYLIRLLSADKSRVWTVRVDARTGQVK